MNIELTNSKRYELEKDNVISLLLASTRSQTPITPKIISSTLNIDIDTVNQLLSNLKADKIIK